MTLLTLQPDDTTGKDTYLGQPNPTFNHGAGVVFAVGFSGVAGTNYKGLIRFDLSSIPARAVINSAVVSLYCIAEDGVTDLSLNFHRSLVDWFEGVKVNSAPDGGQDGSTWNLRNANGSVAWGAAGGLSGTDFFGTATASTTITGTGQFFDWNVLADVQDFVNGTLTNFGWWVSTASTSAARKTFDSFGSVTAAQRPKLVIDYTVVAGTAAGTSTVVGFLISNAIFGAISGTSTATAKLHAIREIAGSASGTSTTTANPKGIFRIDGSVAGTSTVTALPSFEGQLRGTSSGAASAVGFIWGKAIGVARVVGCNPVPYLYLTDGSIKNNGQLNILDFLSEGSGFKLQSWRPQISQYKEGGRFSNGPLAQGRRLRYRNFDNVIETFELSAKSRDQDDLILFQQELLAWQEAAASYWVSDFALSPVYLVAKAARETNSRYAIVHMISIPELENPYIQPFYSVDHAVFTAITPRIERGHWLSTPPGQFECVQISSLRSWTVSGWETGV